MSDFYTWENLPLINFIKIQEGESTAICIDGKKRKEMDKAIYSIQDSYIEEMGGESTEVKRYKKLLRDYVVALREWIMNPQLSGELYMRVNMLYGKKNDLASSIFKDKGIDWDEMIVRVSKSMGFRIKKNEWTAKEFIKAIKLK